MVHILSLVLKSSFYPLSMMKPLRHKRLLRRRVNEVKDWFYSFNILQSAL